MKTTGGRDTFLLFIVLILAIGAVCYLFVIKKSLKKLNDAKAELAIVEQEKAEKDAIIQQAAELDAIVVQLNNSIKEKEGKLLPDLKSENIQRKLYKNFEDAGIPYIVEVSNGEKQYEVVTLPDGTASRDRVMYSSYTIKVSGTDGWLWTHKENVNPATGKPYTYKPFYEQLEVVDKNRASATGSAANQVNKSAQEEGLGDINQLSSAEYIDHKQFLEALKKIQDEGLYYVKIVDINYEDQGQGFGYYSAKINVYAYDLVNRISEVNNDMPYMKWTGAENIATGGLVGLPNYFTVNSEYYTLEEGHPLYGYYLSFTDFDFSVNRPFAAWNMWGYRWLQLESVQQGASKMTPEEFQIEMDYAFGKIDATEYTKRLNELIGRNPNAAATTDTTANTTVNATA